MLDVKQWLREWWATIRFGSPLTRAGRRLRRNLGDGPDQYVEVGPPGTHQEPTEEK